MSATERRLWIRIRGRQLEGWKFRRQHPLGPYYVDFCCLSARLVIEIDGLHHDFGRQADDDMRRDAWLEGHGYRVLRFRVEALDKDIAECADTILAALDEREARAFIRRGVRA